MIKFFYVSILYNYHKEYQVCLFFPFPPLFYVFVCMWTKAISIVLSVIYYMFTLSPGVTHPLF